ncbi:DUF7344 domain-containing protein [Haladaptatus salinisoli]|uniref:DUF7344 domain-containing protein n=1 Tax=Haladaptatus salinisoli TaxID=2884876 RepID=UPI001D0AE271|nr:hypothetical protein [Haladaptatus salinisoli]
MANDAFELLVREHDSVKPLDDVLVGADVPLEVILDVLANRRRRYVLYHLREHETAVVESLVEHVRTMEEEAAIAPSPSKQQRLRVELLHTHLPKLASAGVVRFERTGEFVEYDVQSEAFELFVELAANVEEHSSRQ